MMTPNEAIDYLTGDDAIDLLADLCVHWKRNREKNITPKSVRAAIVLQCHEISSKNLSVRTIEDRLKQLEESGMRIDSELHQLKEQQRKRASSRDKKS